MTATCTECRARQLPGEQWTQNGKGWLCGRCAPPSGCYEDKDEDKDEGLTPYLAPSSSSSYQDSPSYQGPDHDGVPTKTEWLLHKDRQPGPVELPPNVQAVACFFAKVYRLRLADGETRPVPFGCDWVAKHLDMSPMTVWRALRLLESEGVIRRMDPLPGRGKKGVDTYLPGGGS